jgi:transketolase
MLSAALEASVILEKRGILADIYNIRFVKPLDEEAILQAARETKGIVTAEEHSIIGGLGEAVAGVVAEHAPCKVLRVGVKDVFGESGQAGELMDKYGLRARNIIESARHIVG